MPSAEQSVFAFIGINENWTSFMLVGGLIFIRFLIAITLTPYLGVKPVPGMIKTSLALALTCFTFPLVYPSIDPAQVPHEFTKVFVLFRKNFSALYGPMNMMIFTHQSAGSMIDNQRYVANARIFNPALGAQASIFGVFLYQLSIAIFVSLGLHHFFIKAMIESFQTVPLLTFPQFAGGFNPFIDLMIRLTAVTLTICLQLSAPVLIAIFIADLVLGITNRIAPMINVFEMGFNIKGFVGVLLVYLSLPILIYQTRHWFAVMIDYFQKTQLLFR
jgi:flagellar biosynthetic protein FliR